MMLHKESSIDERSCSLSPDDQLADVGFQVNDTTAVLDHAMRILYDRGDKTHELADKTGQLKGSAQGFRRGANRMRKQLWWRDMKMRIGIILAILILLSIIIATSSECNDPTNMSVYL
ncbi:synaptobrevin domain-containing protein [Pochonia chlamydosporia 170]|uniref:Synaptobrevin domain-containing protein n=1 Tax=Pochonia chlamydosporia 170 TaxID=1380566 RepID=A0A219AP33_METCM|nr:synaptobrevin domain-containing protein [Pochonia chlamydosporia 170]OWT42610.1 synaptobrevin domain-containing protein [Pochonia chlamydosporia 170]